MIYPDVVANGVARLMPDFEGPASANPLAMDAAAILSDEKVPEGMYFELNLQLFQYFQSFDMLLLSSYHVMIHRAFEDGHFSLSQ